jgi:hypothetical protein
LLRNLVEVVERILKCNRAALVEVSAEADPTAAETRSGDSRPDSRCLYPTGHHGRP